MSAQQKKSIGASIVDNNAILSKFGADKLND
jgi:hypothetical protein